MVKNRIFYIIAVIALLLFYIFCNTYVTLLIILMVAALSVFGFITAFIAAKKINVKLVSIRPFSVQGTDDPLGFAVKFTNESIIPVSAVKAVLEIKDLSEEAVLRRKIMTPLAAKERKSISATVKSPYSAVIECRITKLFCYDLFGIFSFKIKPISNSDSFVIIPRTADGEYVKTLQSQYITDSDTFSDTERGDDPSQVFEVRSYSAGDDIRKIHWRLSTKYDDLIVKEYSKPVTEDCIVLLESGICGCGEYSHKQLADEILSVFMKLSYELIESEQKFTVFRYSKQSGSLSEFDVTSLEDVSGVVRDFLSQSYSDERSVSLKSFNAAFDLYPDKQVYYLYSSLYFDEETVLSADECLCMIDASKKHM